MSGKGSKRRPCSVPDSVLADNWERAFGKKVKRNLLENEPIRLSARDSETFLTDDGSPPSEALIAAAQRNRDLFK